MRTPPSVGSEMSLSEHGVTFSREAEVNQYPFATRLVLAIVTLVSPLTYGILS